MGRVKAIQMLCLAEITKRMAKATHAEEFRLLSPEVVAQYYMQDMRHLTREQVKVVFIDSNEQSAHRPGDVHGFSQFFDGSTREIF